LDVDAQVQSSQAVSQQLNSVDSKAELEQLMNRAFDAKSLEAFR